MNAPNLFLALEALLFLFGAEGQQLSDFLVKHKSAIENFIMIGHSEGWKHCDIISSISVQHRFLDSPAQPQITVDLKRVLDMDLSLLLSSSNCILISYHITNNQSLASLIKLGAILIEYQQIFWTFSPPPLCTLFATNNIESKQPPFLHLFFDVLHYAIPVVDVI